mgnify:CR=1 FL=1
MKLTYKSPACDALVTFCEKCGCKGYIFPDNLEKNESYGVRDWYWCKACNGRVTKEKKARVYGFIDKGKAIRLSKIRRRKSNLSEKESRGNF